MDPRDIIHVVVTQIPAATPAAPSIVDYGFWASVLHAGLAEKVVMGVLLAFSVVSWAIIIYKWRIIRRAYHESEAFLEVFWNSKRLDAIYQKSEVLHASPLSQVFRAGYIELSKLRKKSKGEGEGHIAAAGTGSVLDIQLDDLENIERSMRRTAATELTKIESLVPFLATTGSTAPFIGLFGTVIGIMNSFQDIGQVGNATLATVAPGVGGALVATAFGLFAAIPAVIAYNHFATKLRVLGTEMDGFSSDFLNIIKRHFFK